MAMRRALILIGLRGAGKSDLGRALAERRRCEFIDLDDITPGLLGCTSAGEAFSTQGEPSFRRAEYRALLDLLNRPYRGILALGGGTPTAPGVPELLAPPAHVVYLRAAPRTLRARLASTDPSTRPSLTGAPMMQEIDEVYTRRDPLYRRLARIVIETDSMTPGQTLHALVAAAGLLDPRL